MLRGRALVLTLCALVFATSLVVAAEPGVAGEVRPFLNCVRPVLDAGGVLEAIFGYNSSLPTTVTIPIGGQNFFFPGQGSLGQPTVFEPGIHNNVFAARFQPTVFQPELTWFIDSGRGLQGGSGLNDYRLSCDPPRFREEWSETGEYIGNDMVHFQGAFWVLRNLQSIPEFPNINDQPGGPSSEWVQWGGLRLGLPPQGSAIASTQVVTFPKSGVLTINDPTVKPDSVILLQYVGDRRGAELVVSQVGAGQFTALGGRGKQFRYVVFN